MKKELLTLFCCFLGLWESGNVQAAAPAAAAQPPAVRYYGNAHETLAVVPQKKAMPSAMPSPAKMGRAGTDFIWSLSVRTAMPFAKKALLSKLTVWSGFPLMVPSLLRAVMSTQP